MKYSYTNTSKEEQILIGFGKIKPGEKIQSDSPINNPNFKLEEEKKKEEQIKINNDKKEQKL